MDNLACGTLPAGRGHVETLDEHGGLGGTPKPTGWGWWTRSPRADVVKRYEELEAIYRRLGLKSDAEWIKNRLAWILEDT